MNLKKWNIPVNNQSQYMKEVCKTNSILYELLAIKLDDDF